MNYDELDNVAEEQEPESYPKNNVVRVEKSRRKGKRDKEKILNVAVIGSVFAALASVVMLMTSIISMALDGVLGEVFKSIL